MHTIPLSAACTEIVDCPHESPNWKTSGIPVVRNFNLVNGQIDMSDGFYVDNETYKRRIRRAVPEAGDIIFSREAPIGNCALIPEGFTCCLGQRLVLLKVNHNVCSSEYLLTVLMSDYVKKQIEGVNRRGSIVSNFNIGDLHKLEIPLIEGAERIADFDAMIRSKIQNNNLISTTLESLARDIYAYWFVQFDFPDENGKPYKSSGGKMVWNEELKREIPEGWEAKCLANLIRESKNGDWGNEVAKKDDDIQVKCFRGADFNSITDDYKVTAPTRFISIKNSDRLLSDGDLVTEISGGSPTQATGRIGYINQKFLGRNEGKMTCSNFCKAFTPVKKEYQYWLYQAWKALYDADVMFNYESKTTGIKNLMFDEFIKWNKIPIPPIKLLKAYQDLCSMYYNKTQDLFVESSKLASLRDFLLPMLMNGQVKVENE